MVHLHAAILQFSEGYKRGICIDITKRHVLAHKEGKKLIIQLLTAVLMYISMHVVKTIHDKMDNSNSIQLPHDWSMV